MKMLIVRHGEAEPATGDDAVRKLTERGESQVRELWQALSDKGVLIKRIIASPFLRTQQTARLIADFYPGLEVESQPLLLSETEPSAVLEWLQELPQDDGLVLVSHMPLVAILTGMLTDCASARLAFVPGMVACLDVEVAAVAGARLRWCISPETGVVK
jgi:phosphohistidine phosphatase